MAEESLDVWREAGREAFRRYAACPQYQALAPASSVDAQYAMKLFLPLETQSPVLVRQPRSPERVAWVEGWIAERAEAAEP